MGTSPRHPSSIPSSPPPVPLPCAHTKGQGGGGLAYITQRASRESANRPSDIPGQAAELLLSPGGPFLPASAGRGVLADALVGEGAS